MPESKNTIGIFHQFETNRKALISQLSGGAYFKFEEIDDWTNMHDASSEVIVICSPEFLPKEVSLWKFKEFIQGLEKTIILVAYDIATWQIDRKNIHYIENTDRPEMIDDLATILFIESVKPRNSGKLKSHY